MLGKIRFVFLFVLLLKHVSIPCNLNVFSAPLPHGQMINVLTNDGHRLFEAALFGSFTLSTPVLFIVCIVYSCYVLGYTALMGVFTYLIFVPVQVGYST